MLLLEWPRLLAAAYLCLIVAAVVIWIRRDRRLDAIPGPKQSVLSTWIKFGLPPNAPQLFRGWAEEYGELFKVRVGWHTWVVINSPQAVKDILDKQVCLEEKYIVD